MGVAGFFGTDEARLVGRREQPCPHPVCYHDLVLPLGHPLFIKRPKETFFSEERGQAERNIT